MRVCIYGAGAIGGHMAVRCALAGAEVSVVARGPHLDAIRVNGLVLRAGEAHHRAPVRAAADPRELGPQDVVIVAVKATGLRGILDGLPALIGPDTTTVFALNGIPWWYMTEITGHSDDPGDATAKALGTLVPPANLAACVVYSANTVAAPGEIHNDSASNRFVLGNTAGPPSDACQGLAALLTAGGAKGVADANIRDAVWRKLLSNIAIGPAACLTGATGRQVAGNAELRPVCLQMVAETQAVARSCGIDPPFDPANFRGESYSDHKSSILQDMELGRPMEIDAIPGAVQRIGRLHAVPTPMLDTVLALLRTRAGLLGLYP